MDGWREAADGAGRAGPGDRVPPETGERSAGSEGRATAPQGEPTTPAAPPRAPGWEAVRRLGEGAQAEVWLVEDAAGARAALKAPRPGADPAALAAEAQAGRVEHPHLLRVLGAVDTDRGLGVLSEHRPAGSLQEMVQRAGPLTPGQAVTVLVPLAQALACLHEHGVVHGDVSPANVLFGVDGSPALADLGVARIVGGAQGAGGTPGFAAPEVLAALEAHALAPGTAPAVGPEADVHAWAALGWYALTGRAPGAPTHRAPLPVLVPQAPPALAVLLDAALSTDPARRPTAQDAAAAAYAAVRPEPVPLGDAAPAEVAHLLPTVLPGAAQDSRRRRRRGRRASVAGIRRGRGERAERGGRIWAGAAGPAGPRRRAVLAAAAVLAVLAVGAGGLAAVAGSGPGEPIGAASSSSPATDTGGEPVEEEPAAADEPVPAGEADDASEAGDADDLAAALEAIGRARTAALTDPRPERVGAYAVPGAPAWEADRELQRRLAEDGFAFSGLEVRLEAAGPARRDDDGALRLPALVHTSAHTVLDRQGRRAAQVAPAQDAVTLVLRRQDPAASGSDPGSAAPESVPAVGAWRVETLEPR